MTDARLYAWRTGYCTYCEKDVIYKPAVNNSGAEKAPRCPACFEFITVTSPRSVLMTLGEAGRSLGVRKEKEA